MVFIVSKGPAEAGHYASKRTKPQVWDMCVRMRDNVRVNNAVYSPAGDADAQPCCPLVHLDGLCGQAQPLL